MQPTASATLARILRVRCPRCGKGPIFRTFFRREECCSACEWKFERESGFWVGGSEVHMIASYGISVVLFIPLVVVLGPTLPVQLGVIFGHIVCSLSLFRYSRATFIGLDFYFDPEARSDEDGGGDGEPVSVPRNPRRPLSRARPQPRTRGSRRAPRPSQNKRARTARR